MHFRKNWLKWRTIVLDDRSLSHGAKAMALFLHTYMNDQNDMAWPSIETICGRFSLSNKTAIKHVNELVKSDYLDKKKRFGTSCQYSINYPSSVISTLMEEVHSSSVDSTLTVVEKLHTNKQYNKQENKQIPQTPEIPPSINPVSWQEFEQHRKEIRKPLSDLARKKAMNVISGFSFDEQARIIDKTIQNRWTGLFPEKTNGARNEIHSSGPSRRASITDEVNRIANKYSQDDESGPAKVDESSGRLLGSPADVRETGG